MSDHLTQPGADLDQQFGEVAVFNQLITREQLDECLAIARDMTGRKFPVFLGKILIQKHYIDRVSVAAILKALGAGRDTDTRINLIKLSPTEHKTLLARARDGGHLTVLQIDEAYDLQYALESHGIDEQLGEILITRGFLSRELIDDLLAGRTARPVEIVAEGAPAPPPAPEPEPEPAPAPSEDLLFGKLAIEKRLVTPEHVEEALFAQRKMKELGVQRRIGEILVAKKRLREPHVQRLLSLQRERYGRISRRAVQASGTDWISPRDETLARALVENGIVSQGEIEECRLIQKELQDLGVEQALGDIAVEHGYVEREIVDGIHERWEHTTGARPKTRRPGQTGSEGPIQVGKHQFKSDALAACYQAVLEQIGVEEDEPAGDGLVRRADGTVRVGRFQSIREATTPARSPIPRVALMILGGFALVSIVGYTLSRALAPEEPVVVPVSKTDLLREEKESTPPGEEIVFVGIIPGGGHVSAEAPIGAVLVDQHRAALWVHDDQGRFQNEFAKFKERIEREDRVCVKVTGIAAPVPEGTALPPKASRKIYLQLRSLEEVGIEEWRKGAPPIEMIPARKEE